MTTINPSIIYAKPAGNRFQQNFFNNIFIGQSHSGGCNQCLSQAIDAKILKQLFLKSFILKNINVKNKI